MMRCVEIVPETVVATLMLSKHGKFSWKLNEMSKTCLVTMAQIVTAYSRECELVEIRYMRRF